MIGTATKNGHAKPTNDAAPSADHDSGRDAGGRFTPGNKLGTGNPFARLVAQMRRQVIDRVSPADLDEVVDNLVLLAKGGDLGAIKMLLGYLVGKPAEVVNPDTLDLEEWWARAQAPTRAETEEVLARVPPDLANAFGVGYDVMNRQIALAEVEKSERRQPDSKAAKAKPGAAKPVRPAGNGRGGPRPITAKSLNAARLTAALGRPGEKANPHAGRVARPERRAAGGTP